MVFKNVIKTVYDSVNKGFYTLKGRCNRAYVAFIHDTIIAFFSPYIALYLRVGDDLIHYSPRFILKNMVVFGLLSVAMFTWMRTYRGMWRYVSMADLKGIALAVTVINALYYPLMLLMAHEESLPRSIPIINWLVLVCFLGGPRFFYRLLRDRSDLQKRQFIKVPKRLALILGSDDRTELFLRELIRSNDYSYQPVGLISFKAKEIGRNIHGISILGTIDDLPEIVAELGRFDKHPQKLIITAATIEQPVMRHLVQVATDLGLGLLRLPQHVSLNTFSEGTELKPIAIEDLLGRPQNSLNRDNMRELIEGTHVLVTGAGGTIGSELVRQIAAFKPKKLTLFDHSEYLLYTISLELSELYPEIPQQTVLGDIADLERLKSVFSQATPDLVFHAAALKHVPMVEDNPNEGIITNVIGTVNLADMCRQYHVQAMVLISTDKAINPSSIMGATKRLAESYCQALDVLEQQEGKGGTRYITVRFGNVLGSTGSVVPLFQRQIARGGPVTITHPDVIRYFMTVQEAVELVLQAAAMGSTELEMKGKIFVLDMGEPIRILDLANQMIRLSGLQPNVDIKIEFTGLRPGEKLYEELFHEGEEFLTTTVQHLLLAAPRLTDYTVLVDNIKKLEVYARARNTKKTQALIKTLVPEYEKLFEEDSNCALKKAG